MPDLSSTLMLAAHVVAALVVALVVTAIVSLVFRGIGRRAAWPASLLRRARVPFRIVLAVGLVWAAVNIALPDDSWRYGVNLAFRVVFIAATSWLIAGLAIFFEDLGLDRYRVDVPDNRVARSRRTQVLIIRRLTVAAIVIVGLGAILLSFPGVEAIGASVLASAGLVSIVAGLAAQSALANVFAGIQIAFSDAIRVDDVVIVEDEWGTIEEITLTYVVVHIWDDRRMVLPSTYFTTTPFQNWTRKNSELLGAVEFDLDWRVTPQQMREHLELILTRTELWDRRVQVLQVTDAVGGYVRVRILVTAIDAPTLFDLRCYVREEMVAWLHETSPQSVPRERVQLVEAETPLPRQRIARDLPGLYTGDADAEARAQQMTGAITLPEREDLR